MKIVTFTSLELHLEPLGELSIVAMKRTTSVRSPNGLIRCCLSTEGQSIISDNTT